MGFYQCLPGLNPFSLWLDDLWVAYLAKSASISYLFAGKAPCPPGFILMLKAVGAILGDGHWQLQLIPLVGYFAQILIIYWLVQRTLCNRALGFFAATLLSANPILALYSLRIKQFSLDSLVTLVILSLVVSCLRHPRVKTFLLMCSVLAATLLVSFTSIFLSAILVNACAYHFLRTLQRSEKKSRKVVFFSAVIYNLIICAIYLILIRHRQTSSLLAYWQDFYLPVNNFSAAILFLKDTGIQFLSGAFPLKLSWLVLFIPVGIYALINQPRERALGWGLLLFYTAIPAASVIKAYPLGGIRTDIFSYPVSIFVATFGIWLLTRKFRAFSVFAAVIALCFFVNEVIHRQLGYPESGDKAVVQRVNATIQEKDGLIVYPWANWAIGYYGKWPTQIVEVEDSTNGFYVHLKRPYTLVLHERYNGIEFRAHPSVIQNQLSPFLANGYNRLVYIASPINAITYKPHEWIISYIMSQGYAIQLSKTYHNADFIVFKRRTNK